MSDEKEKSRKVFESRPVNQAGMTAIEVIHELAASYHELLEEMKRASLPEAARCFAKAQTDLEQSVMWSTKGISRLSSSRTEA